MRTQIAEETKAFARRLKYDDFGIIQKAGIRYNIDLTSLVKHTNEVELTNNYYYELIVPAIVFTKGTYKIITTSLHKDLESLSASIDINLIKILLEKFFCGDLYQITELIVFNIETFEYRTVFWKDIKNRAIPDLIIMLKQIDQNLILRHNTSDICQNCVNKKSCFFSQHGKTPREYKIQQTKLDKIDSVVPVLSHINF